MSRIDELIALTCPGGLTHRTVADVAIFIRGVTYSKQDEQSDGPVRVLRSNNITLSSNTLNFDDVKAVSDRVRVRRDQHLYSGDILLSAASGSKAHVGKVAFIREDLDFVFGGFMAVLRTRPSIEPKFLFHLLIGRGFSQYLERALSTTTINNLSASIVGAFRIPVPPIEVQREIVGILDMFTELGAELEAELEARREQYEYYRDKLLTFEELA
jgi:type I restriction enzyme, S subunit